MGDGKTRSIGTSLMNAEVCATLTKFFKSAAAQIRVCGRDLGKAADDDGDGTSSPFDALADLFEQCGDAMKAKTDSFNQIAVALAENRKAAGTSAGEPTEPLESDSTHRELVSKAVSEVLNVLGNRVIPDGIHGAIPMGVQAVPRFGAAAVGAGAGGAATPGVSAEFQNLVRVD